MQFAPVGQENNKKLIFASALRGMAGRGKLPLLVLDKDGTITEPRNPLEPESADAILKVLAQGAIVAVISGAELRRLNSEVVNVLRGRLHDRSVMDRLYLISENGGQLHRFNAATDEFDLVYQVDLWATVGEENLRLMLAIIDETMQRFQIERKPERGQVVAERSQIKFSPLGNIKDDQLRRSFDPEGERRRVWADYIKVRATQHGLVDGKGLIVDVIVAGTASINVLPRGVSKGYGVDRLAALVGLNNDSIVYMGDKMKGNDADVLGRACVVVNVGADADFEMENTLLLTSDEKGPAAVRAYLHVAQQVLHEFQQRPEKRLTSDPREQKT